MALGAGMPPPPPLPPFAGRHPFPPWHLSSYPPAHPHCIPRLGRVSATSPPPQQPPRFLPFAAVDHRSPGGGGGMFWQEGCIGTESGETLCRRLVSASEQ
uniref:Uncharacterized protein n=1 Tax=Oryza barthii TaxID=65489 RepID=A0A0D3HPJ3_9ORYZ